MRRTAFLFSIKLSIALPNYSAVFACGVPYFRAVYLSAVPTENDIVEERRHFRSCAFRGFELVLPFYLEQVLDFTPDISGLYLLIPPMIMIIAGPAGGLLSDYEGNRMVCSTSAFIGITAFAFFLFSLINPGQIIYMVIALILFGISIGAVASSGASRIIEHSPKGLEITGSAISNLVFYIGMSLGTALYTLVLQSGMSDAIINTGKIAIDEVSASAFSAAMPYVYIFSIILLIAALLFALLVSDNNRTSGKT